MVVNSFKAYQTLESPLKAETITVENRLCQSNAPALTHRDVRCPSGCASSRRKRPLVGGNDVPNSGSAWGSGESADSCSAGGISLVFIFFVNIGRLPFFPKPGFFCCEDRPVGLVRTTLEKTHSFCFHWLLYCYVSFIVWFQSCYSWTHLSPGFPIHTL